MTRPKKNPKANSSPQLPVPHLRQVFSQKRIYLPTEPKKELNEWLPALLTMQLQVIPPVLLTPVEEYQLTNGEAILHFSCHYIVKKKWDKHHPLPPYPSHLKSLLSYFAQTWLCTLELCIQCREFLPLPELQRFPRASDWFGAIIQEEREAGLKMICSNHQIYLEKRSQPYIEPKQPTKHCLVPEMRAFLKELKKFNNPYRKQEDPQMWRLIDIALKINTSDFKKKYWSRYIDSIEKQIKKIESDERILVTQERDGYPIAHTSKRATSRLGRKIF